MDSLTDFWFSKEHIWFNSSKQNDEMITKKFYHLLNLPIDCKTNNCDLMLHYILIYDQCIRHFYRGAEKLPVYASEIALFFSRKLIRTGGIYNLEPKKRCFALMPLRHTFDKDILEYILNLTKKFLEEEQNNKYYRKFYYATIRSLANINNKLSIEREFIIPNEAFFPFNILDKNCNFEDFSKKFIYKRDKMKKWKYLVQEFKTIITKDKCLTLSISGGVDSMVCSYILRYLNVNFKCIMINYGNRNSSNEEVIMVGKWLKYLNVPFYVRNITEIKRSRDKDRDFYENITKDIRFTMYKLLGNDVVLGHNKDDTIENIFANLSKKQNYNNLFGMEKKNVIDDVMLVRPMLNITKKEIFEFANDMGVPYLYDSTPKWSSRGQMRDELVPFLNKFDENIINGLCDLSENIKDLYKSLEKFVLNKASIHIKKSCNDCIIYIKRDAIENCMCSNIIFNQIKKSFRLPRISQKSIKNFTNFAKYNSNKPKRHVLLSNNLIGQIENDNIMLRVDTTL